ncbi:hypothetical protein HpCK38_04620 [Helicobacter pylori]
MVFIVCGISTIKNKTLKILAIFKGIGLLGMRLNSFREPMAIKISPITKYQCGNIGMEEF